MRNNNKFNIVLGVFIIIFLIVFLQGLFNDENGIEDEPEGFLPQHSKKIPNVLVNINNTNSSGKATVLAKANESETNLDNVANQTNSFSNGSQSSEKKIEAEIVEKTESNEGKTQVSKESSKAEIEKDGIPKSLNSEKITNPDGLHTKANNEESKPEQKEESKPEQKDESKPEKKDESKPEQIDESKPKQKDELNSPAHQGDNPDKSSIEDENKDKQKQNNPEASQQTSTTIQSIQNQDNKSNSNGSTAENLRENTYESKMEQDLLWGVYKPYLIFGVMERKPTPLTLRMAFMDNNRMVYRQNEMGSFNNSFIIHDGSSFVEERFQDFSKTLGFSVIFDKESSTSKKQRWSTIVKYDAENKKGGMITFYFSFGIENLDSSSIVDDRYFTLSPDSNIKDSKVKNLWVNNNNKVEGILKAFISGSSSSFSAKGIVEGNKEKNMEVAEHFYMYQIKQNHKNSSLVIFEFSASLENPFFIQLTYESNTQDLSDFPYEESILNSRLSHQRQNFYTKFNNVYPTPKDSKSYELCSQVSMASLLGGLNYMYGPIMTSGDYQYKQKLPMFSGTPSRTGFPRAFLWDDGFHNTAMCQFEEKVCMSVIEHWMATTFPSGWIPREQIRGKEMEEYANLRFLVQLESEANPPTHVLGIDYLFRKSNKKDDYIFNFIERIYPNLKKWFLWFESSQRATQNEHYYKWYANMEGYVLGSGLDDYPRSDYEFLGEYYLDLQVWVTMFADTMRKLAQTFDNKEEQGKINLIYMNAKNSLSHFIDPKTGIYSDIVKNRNNPFSQNSFSKHMGYINLYPLFFGYINENSNEFNKTLELIRDEKRIWSAFGLLSLSQTDNYYNKMDRYWTGPIWININYMVLRGLKLYYPDNSQAIKIYQELRDNIMKNVCKNWEQYGFFYENYQEWNGMGQKNHPFNGWTSLVTLIISEKYI